jgi:NAD(P)-dependent dehydrogenase (short-subunit alcohol dehydrogenase family)
LIRSERHVTSLEGLVAIVTGGGRGIGRSIATELAAAGCRLAFCSRTKSAAEFANELVQEGYDALGVQADVSQVEEFRRFVDEVAERYGRIDILVNNAAVNHSGAAVSMEPERFDEIFSVNVRGLFFAVQAVLPAMIERRFGKIVNVGSFVARSPVPLFTAYSASKAAVLSLTRGLALELAEHDVNVNAVCPATIWSDIWETSTAELTAVTGKSSRDFFAETIEKQPFRRAQTGEQVAAAVIFLCGEAARDITGEALFVSGGL